MKAYQKGKMPQIIFENESLLQVSRILKENEIKKCLIVTDAFISQHVLTRTLIDDLSKQNIVCDVFNQVTPEPTDVLCMEIAKIIKEKKYDCVLGIGGGSPMDGAKAATQIAGIPEDIHDLHEYGKTGHKMKETWTRACMLMLIPTTSGTGAETTASGVITSTIHGMKFSFGNQHISPDYAIIDPRYTLNMPAFPTACGGVDALSHTIEILVGVENNDYTNQILFLCLEKIWKWLPIAIEQPDCLEAREQLSWAAHNALANGGVPNGHAVAHAIGSLYHVVHANACAMVLPTVIRHFANSAQDNIQKMANIMNVEITGDAKKDADRVANAVSDFTKKVGMKTLQEYFKENDIHESCEEFSKKMIPVIMDDFKSQKWMPPIHTGNYHEKVGKICQSIYEEQ